MKPSTAMARAIRATENYWGAIEAEFGMLTAAGVGHLLGARTPAMARNLASRKRRDGTLIGIECRQRVLFPGFQFDHQMGSVVPGIAELRTLGDERGYDEASIVQWLCARTTYLDDGDGARRPVELLTADPGRVLKVARDAWGIAW